MSKGILVILEDKGYLHHFRYLRVFWRSKGYSSRFRGIWVILG